MELNQLGVPSHVNKNVEILSKLYILYAVRTWDMGCLGCSPLDCDTSPNSYLDSPIRFLRLVVFCNILDRGIHKSAISLLPPHQQDAVNNHDPIRCSSPYQSHILICEEANQSVNALRIVVSSTEPYG